MNNIDVVFNEIFDEKSSDKILMSIESLCNSISSESAQDKTENIYIVFFETMGKIKHELIKFFTKSNYTHVGLSTDEKLTDFYDVVSEGLRNFNVNKMLKEDRVLRVFSFPISKFQKTQLKKVLKIFQTNNIKYDSKIFLRLALPIRIKPHPDKFKNEEIKNSNRFICSAFVASVLALISPKVKNYLINKDINISFITPEQIANYPDLEYEFSYNPSNKKKIKK